MSEQSEDEHSEDEQQMEMDALHNHSQRENEERINESCHEDAHADQTNPLRKLVARAVLDALKIKRDSGVSIRTFEEILEYGKKLLLASCDDQCIDRDILASLWPKTWNAVQVLLKEEEYEDAKQYQVCICRKEKRTEADSGISKNYSYSGK